MAPPINQGTLEAPISVPLERRRGLIRPGDVVLGADMVAMFALFWLAKVIFDLDNSMAVFAVAAFASIMSPNAHRRRLSAGGLDDAGHIVRGVCIAYVVASAISAITDESMGDMRVLLIVAVTAIPALISARSGAYFVERVLRRNGTKDRVLLVGAGALAVRVARTIREHSEYGLEAVGAVDEASNETVGLGVPLLGRAKDLPALIEEAQADAVVVAFTEHEEPELIEAIREARAMGVTVWVVPRLHEIGADVKGVENLWGLPLIRLTPLPMHRPQWILKRGVDVLFSSICLLVLAPFLALIALAIAIESGRPILFRQERVGLKGSRFEILKFRSMTQVSRERQQSEWCDDAECRVTRVGKFLRATGLDEIPQLINIFKGEMSLVGPRPERPVFVDEFSKRYAGYAARHRLPAGLTGLSQVNGLRGDTSIEDRTNFDNFYIENWSLSKDIKIALRTSKTLFKP